MTTPQKLYLIDGSGFIFRAFHALPPLKRKDGMPVGAVYGFCTMLLRFLEEAKENYLAVVFDAGRETFRNKIYPEYKANRHEPPEDLIPQFSLIREACAAFNLPALEVVGYEADDLIATYAKQAAVDGFEVIIVSSDKDLMQLVSDHIAMLDPIKNKPIGAEQVFEKFGVKPEQVRDVQALAGDSSDNVPGIPGIGVKTAAELINGYGDLETLLAKAGEIKQPKRREMLTQHADKARLSKELVTLCDTVPLPMPIADLKQQEPERLVLGDFLRQQGFASLLARLDKMGTNSTTLAQDYETVANEEALKQWIDAAFHAGLVAIDTETTSLDAQQAELVGISMAVAPGKACYIPLAHKTLGTQLDREKTLRMLAPLLNDLSVLKVGHNLKYDLAVLAQYNTTINPITDTMVMSYDLDAGKHGHGMDELAERHLGHVTIKFTDVAGTGKNQKTFDQVDIPLATKYAAEDADVTLQLYHLLKPRLVSEQVLTVYELFDRPLIPVVVAMENAGILVNQSLLKSLGDEFSSRLQVLEQTIHQLAGRIFTIASPKQLGEVLFDELGLPAPRKTKTGGYSTDAEVLEELFAQGHNIAGKVLEWRELAKLKSTYIDGLLASIHPKTQRVHTSYALTGTTTGRLSSSNPNLQNIPIRTEEGRKIRAAFVAPTGFKLLSLDYSQIELRLLAHVAEIESLKQAFHQGKDIHTLTASEIFGIPIEQIDSSIRRKAKAINFGIIYGMSAYGLSQQLGIAQGEAAAYIKTYFERYPGIQQYMERMKVAARREGFVKTLFGRKCYTPGINDRNPVARGFAERQAINAPLQGTAADIIKRAMIRCFQALKDQALPARLLLQVHDELVLEVKAEAAATVIPPLKEIMEQAATLSVPLIVESGLGDHWGEAH